MPADRTAPVLILFARTPVPGVAKTRLQTRYSASEAGAIAAIMLDETCKRAHTHWPGDIVLAAWPSTNHPQLRSLARRYSLTLAAQPEGDLGDKMYMMLERMCVDGRSAAVMGCDVPHCPAEVFVEAHAVLAAGGAVLGPTADGGYYLVGTNRPAPELFAGIRWGGSDVAAQTRDRASGLGFRFHELPMINDVDTWEDVQDVAPKVPALGRFLRTRSTRVHQSGGRRGR